MVPGVAVWLAASAERTKMSSSGKGEENRAGLSKRHGVRFIGQERE
jgi:hypothetical protein